jgi:hypothetical protein
MRFQFLRYLTVQFKPPSDHKPRPIKPFDSLLKLCHPTQMDQATLEHLEQLASRNIHLTHSQLEILKLCAEKPRTKGDLAKHFHVTYQAIQKHVRKLEGYNLLTRSTFRGESGHYYKCHQDISETADITFKVKWRKQTLSFEEFIGALNLDNPWMIRNNNLVFYALTHLYHRTLSKQDNRTPLQPGGPEIKSLLLSVAKEFEEFASVLRTITDMPLFNHDTDHVETMGEIPKSYIFLHGDRLATVWNKEVSVKGLLEDTDNKKLGLEEIQAELKRLGRSQSED